jgi:1-acyl-sn-glycerol-3-phosphate acyltransferase
MKPFLWFVVNTAQWLLVALWTMIWTSIAMVAAAITRHPDIGLALARHAWSRTTLRIGGVRLDVHGREQVAIGRPCLLACNHQSFVDIPVLFRALPVDLRFVAKHELRSVPFLGWYMEAMGMVFVDRRRRRSGAAGVDAVTTLLRTGACVLSFPAGTRRRPDEPQGFKAAAFAPAVAAGVPVVPVALYGERDMLARGWRLRPGLVRVVVCEPIETAGLALDARDDIARRAEAAVTAVLEQLAAAADAAVFDPALAGERA